VLSRDFANSSFPTRRHQALAAVAAYLRCPVCTDHLDPAEGRLVCSRTHSFDIARQGYVNLTVGRAGPGIGDSPAMAAARAHFLSRGHYEPLLERIRSLAECHEHEPVAPGIVADLAGGTGYYLAGVLDMLPHRYGVCVDLSVPALRRAARAHPRAAAVGADVWRPLPLADRSAALVLSVFGPRNAAQTERILIPGGALIMAVPGTTHLCELRRPLGLIGIDVRKQQRIDHAYRAYQRSHVSTVTYQLNMDHADLTAMVTMGPSAHHIAPHVLAARVQAMPTTVSVTIDVRIMVFQHRGDPAA
jgi:23S rRNA (guanine745-N1)-methyltransferase